MHWIESNCAVVGHLLRRDPGGVVDVLMIHLSAMLLLPDHPCT